MNIRGLFFLLVPLLFLPISLFGQEADSSFLIEQVEILLEESKMLSADGRIKSAHKLLQKAQGSCQSAKNWEKYVEIGLDIVSLLDGDETSIERKLQLHHSIQIARSKLGEGHKLIVTALRMQGEFFIENNQLDSATIVLNESIQQGLKGKQWEELAWSYIVESVVHYHQFDLVRMEKSILKSIDIIETKIDDPDDYIATIDQLQSILYAENGDYQKALIASQKTLERYLKKKKLSNIDSFGLANAYNNQAAIYDERGDYIQAIRHYKLALALHQEINNSPISNQITIGNNLGYVLRKNKDWILAEYYLKRSKSLLSLQPNFNNYKDWIQNQQLLTANYVDQEKYNDAIQLLDDLIPQTEKFNYYQEWSYVSFARALIPIDRPQEAKKYLNLALVKQKKFYGNKHPKIALLTRHVGEAYLKQDSLDLALKEFQKALVALTNGEDPIIENLGNPDINNVSSLIELLPILEFKGLVLSRLGKEDSRWLYKALKTYRDATKVIDALRSQNESEEAKLLLSSKAKGIYEALINLLFEKYQLEKNEDLLIEAFLYSEKSKALLLLELIQTTTDRQDYSASGIEGDSLLQSMIARGKSLKTEVLFFESELKNIQKNGEPSDSLKIVNIEKALADLYQKKNQWKSEIKLKFPAYYNLQYNFLPLNLSELREHLIPDNGVFMEYFIGKDHSFVFVCDNDTTHFIRLDSPASLSKSTDQFRHLLGDHEALSRDAQQALKSYNEESTALYDLILKEAFNKVSDQSHSITLVPDAFLNTIPFEALTTEIVNFESKDFSKLPYLFYEYDIHYGYSANTLMMNRKRYDALRPNSNCLALAYKDDQDVGLQDENMTISDIKSNSLQGSIDEVNLISEYFTGDFIYDSTATIETFTVKAKEYGILHLAIHGSADFENPKFAYLKFPDRTNDTLNDNLLYHYEIAEMDLDCQMAVLSACETGLGKYASGEGVFSLARGFMLAGVPSVVMSLWQIDDKSTSQLLPNYYKYLLKNLPKHKALQNAKIEYLQNADLKYKHPYYWSGIVLLGNEQALKQTASISNWMIYIGIFLFLITAIVVFRKKFNRSV